jgi:serine/threonine protein kinase
VAPGLSPQDQFSDEDTVATGDTVLSDSDCYEVDLGDLEEPPDVIGPFLLIDTIGKGAMGLVFRAQHVQTKAIVALKLTSNESSSSSKLEQRLRREGHLLQRIDHPNVVKVFDVGKYGGRFFVAMELVRGQLLDEWLAAGHRLNEILDIFAQAASGLASAHQAGVLHRDFKPSNVLVTESQTAKVMDFGLARLRPGAVAQMSAEVTMTKEGSILGTPVYMSPEQLAGLPIDETTDQYSFCVALYEAIYGKRPYSGSNLLELRLAAVRGNAEFPAHPGVPPNLEELLRRGLRPKPHERHASMMELLEALRAV